MWGTCSHRLQQIVVRATSQDCNHSNSTFFFFYRLRMSLSHALPSGYQAGWKEDLKWGPGPSSHHDRLSPFPAAHNGYMGPPMREYEDDPSQPLRRRHDVVVKADPYQTSMEAGEPARFSSHEPRSGYPLNHEASWQAGVAYQRGINNHLPMQDGMGPPTTNTPTMQQPSSYDEQPSHQRLSHQRYHPYRSIHAPPDFQPLQHRPDQQFRRRHGDPHGQHFPPGSAPPPSQYPEQYQYAGVNELDASPMAPGYQDDPFQHPMNGFPPQADMNAPPTYMPSPNAPPYGGMPEEYPYPGPQHQQYPSLRLGPPQPGPHHQQHHQQQLHHQRQQQRQQHLQHLQQLQLQQHNKRPVVDLNKAPDVPDAPPLRRMPNPDPYHPHHPQGPWPMEQHPQQPMPHSPHAQHFQPPHQMHHWPGGPPAPHMHPQGMPLHMPPHTDQGDMAMQMPPAWDPSTNSTSTYVNSPVARQPAHTSAPARAPAKAPARTGVPIGRARRQTIAQLLTGGKQSPGTADGGSGGGGSRAVTGHVQDYPIHVKRIVTCKTYLKRLHVTQAMAGEGLLQGRRWPWRIVRQHSDAMQCCTALCHCRVLMRRPMACRSMCIRALALVCSSTPGATAAACIHGCNPACTCWHGQQQHHVPP